MDKDVAAADLAQQDALGGVVQEVGVVPGHRPGTPEQEVQDNVLGTRTSTTTRPTEASYSEHTYEPDTYSSSWPKDEPADKPEDAPKAQSGT